MRALQLEGTRAASSKEMKKGTKGICFFTRQGYVTIRLLKMKRTEKGNTSLRLPEPQHHSACRKLFNTHAYWAALV